MNFYTQDDSKIALLFFPTRYSIGTSASTSSKSGSLLLCSVTFVTDPIHTFIYLWSLFLCFSFCFFFSNFAPRLPCLMSKGKNGYLMEYTFSLRSSLISSGSHLFHFHMYTGLISIGIYVIFT